MKVKIFVLILMVNILTFIALSPQQSKAAQLNSSQISAIINLLSTIPNI